MIDRRQFLAGTAAMLPMAATPVLSAVRTNEGQFEITARATPHKLHPQALATSDLWLANGSLPGPEIRARKGETIKVRFRNELPEPSSLHWHGIRIENAMDGVSGLTQNAVKPGGTFDYEFVAPDAGTYWYHAHNKSWNQVARGLYGPLIIDGDAEGFDARHDITLVIDDWRIDEEAKLELSSFGSLMDWSHGGRLGNYITVNGRPDAGMTLNAGEAYRLRLINASNARVLNLDLEAIGATLLGYDGQLFERESAFPYGPMLLSPAQRMDVLLVPNDMGTLTLNEVSDEPYAIMSFNVIGNKKAISPISLRPNQLPEPDLKNARTIRLDMTGGAMGGGRHMMHNGSMMSGRRQRETGQMWAFNGVANIGPDPLFDSVEGETIIVETVNQTAFVHAMHLHGHHFRVIEREGMEINDGQPWRDTFLIGPQQTTRIAFVADNPGKWLLHCHMLEHAAAGMNTWFAVA
jgi:FtsP/CotA-like multicopper oxidase with cupredoxin domain